MLQFRLVSTRDKFCACAERALRTASIAPQEAHARTLQLDDRGSDVIALQQFLFDQCLLNNISVTGYFRLSPIKGPATILENRVTPLFIESVFFLR